MNQSFFANISHEFRNPVAMIEGPLNLLKKAPELSVRSANMVKLISQSTTFLLKLVDQMLDFNHLENDTLRLAVSRKDAAFIVISLVKHFQISAAEKGIHIEYKGITDPVFMLLDEDKLSKITDNLLTNALYHTPQNGTITVDLEVIEGKMTVSISNTGDTIPKDQLDNIFKKYYESDSSIANWGRGIGLYYVKRLVTLHHGNIKADNIGNGIKFSFYLPEDDHIYTESEHALNNKEMTQYLSDEEIIHAQRYENKNISITNSRKRLLIVENDINMSYFIRKLFENEYTVYNRYDAESAYDTIEEIQPNIIISDTTFTNSSGLELCTKIKENEKYHETIVIIISANHSIKEQIDALKAGSEAYISKPFSPDYLQELVRTKLRQQEENKKMIKNISEDKDKKTGMSARDKNFIKQLYKFMEEHLMDGELNITRLCRTTLISRAKLYTKIKGLTGSTPNELFRNYKLNKASRLLKEGKYNISEIAERSGFSSIAYFSRTFKKHYGVCPKDYN